MDKSRNERNKVNRNKWLWTLIIDMQVGMIDYEGLIMRTLINDNRLFHRKYKISH